jgi:hypothetical protein
MLPLDIQSSSDIVSSPSIICRFHHCFRRFRRCSSFSSFAVVAISTAASVSVSVTATAIF